MKKTLAIIGRPNVGKSTLFNRLTGTRHALVDDQPGVTRDRREGEGHIGPLEFSVIDTAGMEEASADSLEARMLAQTEMAIAEADCVLMVVDAKVGVTPEDEYFAKLLRRHDTPILLAANKAESKNAREGLIDAYRLGLGEPIAISAEHGEGMGDLYDALAPLFEAPAISDDPAENDDTEEGKTSEEAEERLAKQPLQIAIVGRPNAGKSTFINRLMGEERVLTGPEAGITRDAITIPFTYQDRELRLVDTAGMRRKSNVHEKLEKLAVTDTRRAIQYANVVVLMIDATQPLEKQDVQIGSMIAEEGRACVLAVNKWDKIVHSHTVLMEDIEDHLGDILSQMAGLAVVPLSAEEGTNLDKVMQACFDVYEVWNRRISTSKLNAWLSTMLDTHTPPLVRGRRIKLKYMTQIKTRPPTFALHVNMSGLPPAYQRYLTAGLRRDFDLPGVPIRLLLKKKANPYDSNDRD